MVCACDLTHTTKPFMASVRGLVRLGGVVA
jgi:hypothetical protein